MLEKVLELVSQIMKVPINELSEESSPEKIESWDSLSHMTLILALEEAFDVIFTDEEIVEMVSVKLILETLKRKQASFAEARTQKKEGGEER